MATRAFTGQWIGKGVHKTTWTGLANGDNGSPQSPRELPDRTFQALGTFGAGGSVAIEGSNDGGTTWKVLTDPQGNAIALTSANPIEVAEESPEFIRPNVTAGDGTTSLTVIMVAQSPRR